MGIVLHNFLCAADGWFVAGCLAMCLVRFFFFALRLIVSLRVCWAGGARPSPEAAPFRSPLLGFSEHRCRVLLRCSLVSGALGRAPLL